MEKERERAMDGGGGWGSGSEERALGVREQGPGPPVDMPHRLERSAISLSRLSDTIWRGSILLKAVSEWHMGELVWGTTPPCLLQAQSPSCEKSTEQLFLFFPFCSFKRQQQPPPSLVPSCPPPLQCLALSLTLSLFFPLALRHSLVTARSSNRTTLVLTRTRGSPEMLHGAPFGRRQLKWKRKKSFCSFFSNICHATESSYRHKGSVF